MRSRLSRLDFILFALIALMLAAQAVSIFLSWDSIYPWIDIPLHIAGGFWIGLLFMYIFLERLHVLPRDISFLPLFFLATGFATFIGAGWEVYQYLSAVFIANHIPFGGSMPGLHFDTIKDIFNDTVGGALAASVYYFFALRRGTERPEAK